MRPVWSGGFGRIIAVVNLAAILIAWPMARAADGDLTLEQRVERVERLLESQVLVEMMMRLDALQQELQQLRGASETQGYNLDAIQRRQREMYLDLDRRLREIETGSVAAQSPVVPSSSTASSGDLPAGISSESRAVSASQGGTAAAAPQTTGAAAGGVADAATAEEQQAYQAAFALLNDRQYSAAIDGFRAFLASYPNGRYADNAQYWLGEANYVTRRFPEALEEFNKVVSNHPSSHKVPDALLKVGFTLYEMRQWEQARQVLTSVVAKYPGTTAARLSQDRLNKMKLEGR